MVLGSYMLCVECVLGIYLLLCDRFTRRFCVVHLRGLGLGFRAQRAPPNP